MQIIDLSSEHTDLFPQVAALLVAGFRENWPNAWPSRVARDEEGSVLGKPDILMAKRVGRQKS